MSSNKYRQRRGGGQSPKALRKAAEAAFFRHAQMIIEGYVRRKEYDKRVTRLNRRIVDSNESRVSRSRRLFPTRPPFDQAEGFIKRESYALLRRLVANENGDRVIRSIIREYDSEPRYPSYHDNPYYWGLVAINSAHKVLDLKRISRYAKQLKYAARNNVTPQHLIGFIYQIKGSTNLQGSLESNVRDPSLNMAIKVEDTLSD